MNPAIVNIDKIGHAVAIDIPNQNSPRVVAIRKSRAVAHLNALSPIAIPEVWPILDVTVMDQNYVPHAVARHVATLDALIGKTEGGKRLERLAFDAARFTPAFVRIVKETFEPRP